jgi:hypothetical protein
MQLMTFGWSNCANELNGQKELESPDHLATKFQQLFKQVKQSDCVEADRPAAAVPVRPYSVFNTLVCCGAWPVLSSVST